MGDTTSLDELPVAPGIDNRQGNVQLSVAENVKISSEMDIRRIEEERKQMMNNMQNTSTGQGQMSATDMNSFISGLQQASAQGGLSIPSRDIPQIVSQVAMDNQARSDYIPQSQTNDYIGQAMNNDEIIRYHQKKKKQDDTMDVMYEELQVPILISILFFIFQLPSIRKYIYRLFPSLLKSDGNPSLGGYLLSSLIFGVGFYVLNKIMKHFSEF